MLWLQALTHFTANCAAAVQEYYQLVTVGAVDVWSPAPAVHCLYTVGTSGSRSEVTTGEVLATSRELAEVSAVLGRLYWLNCSLCCSMRVLAILFAL